MRRQVSWGLLLGAVGFCIAEAAQGPRAEGEGARLPGGVVSRVPSADPADARIVTLEQFRSLETARRRAIMYAWATGSPETAGPSLLGMIAQGLGDHDPGVRILSAGVVQRIVLATNLARVRSTTVRTRLHEMPAIHESLMVLIGDPLAQVRREALGALRGFHFPPDAALEGAVLSRSHTELDTSVRALMIAVLGDFAVWGSRRSVDAIADAFADPSPDVRHAAVLAAARLPPKGWVERVVMQLSAREWWLRLAAAQVLRRHKDAGALPNIDFASYLIGESDPRVTAALERLIDH